MIKPGRVPKQLRVSRCKEEMAGLLEEKALQDEVFGVESELIDGSDYLEDLIASRVVSSDEDWLPLKPMKAKRAPKNAKGPVAAMKQGRVSPKKRPAGRMAPAAKVMK